MQFRVNVPLAVADITTPPASSSCRRTCPASQGQRHAASGPAGDDWRTPRSTHPGRSRPRRLHRRGRAAGRCHSEEVGRTPNRKPALRATPRLWELYNFTDDAHPIHIHEVFFEVVNRQRIDKETGLPIQAPRPPEPCGERLQGHRHRLSGRSDTGSDDVRQLRASFVWHCHIVEHEDNEMMRPYRDRTGAAGAAGRSLVR